MKLINEPPTPAFVGNDGNDAGIEATALHRRLAKRRTMTAANTAPAAVVTSKLTHIYVNSDLSVKDADTVKKIAMISRNTANTPLPSPIRQDDNILLRGRIKLATQAAIRLVSRGTNTPTANTKINNPTSTRGPSIPPLALGPAYPKPTKNTRFPLSSSEAGNAYTLPASSV